MNRSTLNALLTERALTLVVGSSNSLSEHLLDKAEGPQIKNVCAKISSALADEIDSICGLLDISKRRFLEAAIIEAISQAKTIIREECVEEHLEAVSNSSKNTVKGDA